MRFSIIIPVYNAEKWLESCVRSVLNQSCEDCEILLINDGSQDKSELLCQQLAAVSSRIRYASQKNSGPSAARNRGIGMAQGEYLLFLDADDTLMPGSLEKLNRLLLESGADALIAPLLYRDADSETQQAEYCAIDADAFARGDPWQELARARFSTPASKVIIRREIICGNGIRFPVEYRIGEDIFMMAQGLCKCEKIVFCPDCYYVYNQNAGSITHTVNYGKISTTMALCGDLYRMTQGETGTKQTFLHTQMSMLLISFLQHYSGFDGEQKKQIRSWMRANAGMLRRLAATHPATKLAGAFLGPGNAFLLASYVLRAKKQEGNHG